VCCSGTAHLHARSGKQLQRRSQRDLHEFNVPRTSTELTASAAEQIPARLRQLELRVTASNCDVALDKLLQPNRARDELSLALREPGIALASA
jgi:hypothetical protein